MKDILAFDGDFRWLSNFYSVKIDAWGREFASVEAAYQAAKEIFSLNRDDVIAEFTRDTSSEAKKRGQGKTTKLRNSHLVVTQLPKYWEAPAPGQKHPLKVRVMLHLLKIKFDTPELKEQLLATGDAILIEGNTWGDTYWGVCGTQGENTLGKLLMSLRKQLKHEMTTQQYTRDEVDNNHVQSQSDEWKAGYIQALKSAAIIIDEVFKFETHVRRMRAQAKSTSNTLRVLAQTLEESCPPTTTKGDTDETHQPDHSQA